MRFLFYFFIGFFLSACGDGEFEEPMTITGWSKTATLVSMNDSVRETAQASFRTVNGAGAVTVQFEVIDTTLPVPFRFIAPTAKLTWSVEGNSVTRITSIRNGMAITGVGEHFAVELWDAAWPLDPAVPPLPAQQTEYTVNITAGPGTRGPAQFAPTVIPFIDTINALGTPLSGYGYSTATNAGFGTGVATIDLTDYPGVTGLFFTVTDGHTPVPAGTIYVRGIGNGGLTTFGSTEVNQGRWIPIPPSTTSITFTVNPADLANTYLISASLSVDG